MSAGRRASRRLNVYPWAAVAACLLAGCGGVGDGDLPERFPVTGRVTYNGAPVPGATVTFRGDGTGVPPAYGVTDASGAFSLTTYTNGDGAVPGEHVVTVSKKLSSGGGGSKKSLSMEEALEVSERPAPSPSQNQNVLPERYADATSSGLSYTVSESDENHFEIALTD